MIEIKDRFTARVIYSSAKATTVREALLELQAAARADLSRAGLSGAYLSRAYLSGVNLSRADLSRANLSGADLSGANLSGAYLSRAYLSGADLSGADLSGANLSGAKGVSKLLAQPLNTLKFQVGTIRMFKIVTSNLESPIAGSNYNSGEKLTYQIGECYSVDNASVSESEDCGAGLHVATLEWIFKKWTYGEGYRILICEFTADDIACIPDNPEGKFRLHRMKVVGELAPQELGLDLPKEEVKA